MIRECLFSSTCALRFVFQLLWYIRKTDHIIHTHTIACWMWSGFAKRDCLWADRWGCMRVVFNHLNSPLLLCTDHNKRHKKTYFVCVCVVPVRECYVMYVNKCDAVFMRFSMLIFLCSTITSPLPRSIFSNNIGALKWLSWLNVCVAISFHDFYFYFLFFNLCCECSIQFAHELFKSTISLTDMRFLLISYTRIRARTHKHTQERNNMTINWTAEFIIPFHLTKDSDDFHVIILLQKTRLNWNRGVNWVRNKWHWLWEWKFTLVNTNIDAYGISSLTQSHFAWVVADTCILHIFDVVIDMFVRWDISPQPFWRLYNNCPIRNRIGDYRKYNKIIWCQHKIRCMNCVIHYR